VLTGLTNAQTYSISVTAAHAEGNSPAVTAAGVTPAPVSGSSADATAVQQFLNAQTAVNPVIAAGDVQVPVIKQFGQGVAWFQVSEPVTPFGPCGGDVGGVDRRGRGQREPRRDAADARRGFQADASGLGSADQAAASYVSDGGTVPARNARAWSVRQLQVMSGGLDGWLSGGSGPPR